MQFLHYGVPVSEKKPGMTFLEALGVHVVMEEPYSIEWLYFEPNSPMHKSIQTKNHAAFRVDDLDAELKGKTVVCEPFPGGPGVRLAFIEIDDAVIELMESK